MRKALQKSRNLRFAVLLCLLATFVQAQNDRTVQSRLNENGSMTFVYRDTTARRVRISCDCRLRGEKPIKGESYNKAKMVATEPGVWTYTTPRLTPEVYTYQFLADKKAVTDPTNADSIRVQDTRMSVFMVDGTDEMRLYQTDKMLGSIDTLDFVCGNDTIARRILVYTPPYHVNSGEEYPVLYLLHGINGNVNSWNDRGRAMQVVDNLIREGRIVPIVLVIPDANPLPLVGQDVETDIMQNLMHFHNWKDLDFERCFPALDQYLSERYHLAPERSKRAVAGLSAGGSQSANLINMYDTAFAVAGLFSPIIFHHNQPRHPSTPVMVYTGKADVFHFQAKGYCRKLKKQEVPYKLFNTESGHTWRNWRKYFTDFVLSTFPNNPTKPN